MSIRETFKDYAEELYPEDGTDNWNERQRERQEDFLDGIEFMHKATKKKLRDKMEPIEAAGRKLELAPRHLTGYNAYADLLQDIDNITPEDHV